MRPRHGSDSRLGDDLTRVLVAEDDSVLRAVVVALLENLGYDAVGVGDGLAAWNHLRAESFDVLVTDVEMPELTGLELARRAAASHSTRVIAVMSGESRYRSEALEAGASLFVVKPFGVTELCQQIDLVLAGAPVTSSATGS